VAVRSTKLVAATGLGSGQNVIYTAGTQYVVLIKSVGVFNSGGSSGEYSFGALDVGSGNRCDWFGRYSGSPLGAMESETTQGWWVLAPGDNVYLESIAGGPYEVWVSGALLL